MNKHLFRLLIAASALVLVSTVICLASALTQNRGMNHVSGAWVSLAVDVADGVFYRPLVSEDGYGGTRFMPLQFLIHGSLIKAGGDPALTGHALSLLSMLALMGGIYCLLRWMGVGRGLAAVCAILVLFSAVVQLALWTIRGDLLAAALNIWGLAFSARVLSDSPRKGSVWLAALFFVLAFTAKLTTIFGFAAAITAFFLSNHRKTARKLGLLTFVGVVLAAGLIHVASEGRALEAMRACASGGATLEDIAKSPITWFRIAQGADPWSLALIALAVSGLLLIPGSAWRELPSIALLATAGVTVFLFGSPGVDYNHLLDLHVIALIFFAVQLARLRLDPSLGAVTLAMVAVMGSAYLLFRVRSSASMTPLRGDIVRTLERISNSGGPLLSENPWYPILKHERPYMLDPFMFRLISRRNPSLAHDLSEKLQEHFFRAVILQNDPQTVAGKYELDDVHFGRGFTDELLGNYELEGRQGILLLYRPKGLTQGARRAQ